MVHRRCRVALSNSQPAPRGAGLVGCILQLTDDQDSARLWWQNAGAGEKSAGYLLYLHHLARGETTTADWWLGQIGIDPNARQDTVLVDEGIRHADTWNLGADLATILRVLSRLADPDAPPVGRNWCPQSWTMSSARSLPEAPPIPANRSHCPPTSPNTSTSSSRRPPAPGPSHDEPNGRESGGGLARPCSQKDQVNTGRRRGSGGPAHGRVARLGLPARTIPPPGPRGAGSSRWGGPFRWQ